jgi:hypothetical protein
MRILSLAEIPNSVNLKSFGSINLAEAVAR